MACYRDSFTFLTEICNTQAQVALRRREIANRLSRSLAVVSKPFYWVAIKTASLADCVPVVIRIANSSYGLREHI
jgi:hypothetical protein